MAPRVAKIIAILLSALLTSPFSFAATTPKPPTGLCLGVGCAPSDTTPPSAPAGLSATAASSSQIDLSWTASTDNVGVTGYNVYRGGAQIATVTSGTSFSNTGLSASTAYSYNVAAYDAAGNVSAQSAAASATTPPAAPVITSAPTATGTTGKPFSYQIAATNSPTAYNATGLPTGLTANINTGMISGTPTTVGTSNITIRAINVSGTGIATLTLTIANPATTGLIGVTADVPSQTVTVTFSYPVNGVPIRNIVISTGTTDVMNRIIDTSDPLRPAAAKTFTYTFAPGTFKAGDAVKVQLAGNASRHTQLGHYFAATAGVTHNGLVDDWTIIQNAVMAGGGRPTDVLGMTRSYEWSATENLKDQYTFDVIKQDLIFASQNHFQLTINLMTKGFGSNALASFPAYIQNYTSPAALTQFTQGSLGGYETTYWGPTNSGPAGQSTAENLNPGLARELAWYGALLNTVVDGSGVKVRDYDSFGGLWHQESSVSLAPTDNQYNFSGANLMWSNEAIAKYFGLNTSPYGRIAYMYQNFLAGEMTHLGDLAAADWRYGVIPAGPDLMQWDNSLNNSFYMDALRAYDGKMLKMLGSQFRTHCENTSGGDCTGLGGNAGPPFYTSTQERAYGASSVTTHAPDSGHLGLGLNGIIWNIIPPSSSRPGNNINDDIVAIKIDGGGPMNPQNGSVDLPQNASSGTPVPDAVVSTKAL